MNIFYVVSCRELCEEQQWFWKLHGWTDIYYLLSISLPCFYPSNNIATSYKITPLQIQYIFVFIYFFKCKLLPQQFRAQYCHLLSLQIHFSLRAWVWKQENSEILRTSVYVCCLTCKTFTDVALDKVFQNTL